MSFTVKWLVPELVIYSVFEGDITSEVEQYDAMVVNMFATSSYPFVHTISDITRVTAFEANSESMNLNFMRNAKNGWIISVGAISLSVLRMMAALSLTVNISYREALNLDETLSILQRKVPALPDLNQAFSQIQSL